LIIERQKESDVKENQNIINYKEDEVCEQGQKDNEAIIQKKYNRKTLFSNEELIKMLKTIKINELKNEINPISEEVWLTDLINEIKDINNIINNLSEKYDYILNKNGINLIEKID